MSTLHYRVCDKGLFLAIARRLARDGAKVSYWSPAEKAFPTIRDQIGDGFPDIQRVNSIWDDKNTVDCWVFPDVGLSAEQEELLSQGCNVWGAREASQLEIYRGKFLEALASTDLPIPDYVKVVGITELRNHLRDVEDRWIKISRFRGDFETFHWRSWEEDETTLDYYALKFGPFREAVTFYIFSPIESENEDGCDTWCIDGAYPKLVLHGMEAKDKGYLCTFQPFADLPPEVRKVSEAFAPVLRRYGYRSFFSTEVRITKDGESFFIDPTCRAGSPPSQVMTEMLDNFPEIIMEGARGNLVEPYPAAKFGVQCVVNVKGELGQWKTLQVGYELDRWLKCGNAMMHNGCIVFPPDPEQNYQQSCWLVGIGDTLEEAIKHLTLNAAMLPDGASCDVSPLADLLVQVQKAEADGMKFTPDKVPGPEIVLTDKP